MRKFIVILGLILLFLGCQKKTRELKEMQEPLSPEINSLISNPTNTSGINLSESMLQENQQDSPILLPPPGPYKPTNRQIQIALKNAGFYTGPIDGVIGPKTLKAIKEFQNKNNLEVDGKVGPKTWAMLSRYLNVTDTLSFPKD